MAVATEHYSDSMMATAWTCSECGEDTYDGDQRYGSPSFCCRCGAEFIAERKSIDSIRVPKGERPTSADIHFEFEDEEQP